MTVTEVHKDPENRRLTIASHFDATIERVWRLWADPRRLERWWGPPDYPATVTEHELRPGGKVTFYMTGPAGERMDGWLMIRTVDAPLGLAFDLNDASIPTLAVQVELRPGAEGGTVMTIETSFPDDAAMDQMIAMGYPEGMSAALGQIDAILAAEPA